MFDWKVFCLLYYNSKFLDTSNRYAIYGGMDCIGMNYKSKLISID